MWMASSTRKRVRRFQPTHRLGCGFNVFLGRWTVSSFETEAWLGATIVSRDGHTLVCAPRATDKLTGKCYVGRRYESLETGLYSVDFAYGSAPCPMWGCRSRISYSTLTSSQWAACCTAREDSRPPFRAKVGCLWARRRARTTAAPSAASTSTTATPVTPVVRPSRAANLSISRTPWRPACRVRDERRGWPRPSSPTAALRSAERFAATNHRPRLGS